MCSTLAHIYRPSTQFYMVRISANDDYGNLLRSFLFRGRQQQRLVDRVTL